MYKICRNQWKKKLLSLVLIAAMLLEPSMVSNAAEVSEGSGKNKVLVETESETDFEEESSEQTKVEESSEPVETVISVNAVEDFVMEGDTLVRYNGTEADVEIPEGVVTIGRVAFAKNTTIQSVKFPNSLKKVEYSAFDGCSNLAVVEMNNDLLQIGGQAFHNAGLSGALMIPGSVQTIESSAFESCAKLEEVTFLNGSSKTLTMAEYAFRNCTKLKKVTLPDSLTAIPNCAFAKDSLLEEIAFGNTLTSISQDAFNQCVSLKKVEFPTTLTSIGDRAFYGCTQLREVQLPEGLLSIGQEAFASVGFGGKTETQATEYGSLTIPSTVTSIGYRAFLGCPYLQEIIFTSGVTEKVELGEAVFRECGSLKKVTMSDAVKEIPGAAFWKCDALTEVVCSDKLVSIGNNAFSYCKALKTIQLPVGLQSIGQEAFSYAAFGGKTETQAIECMTLTIPGTVVSIGERAFYKSPYLGEVVFASGSVEELKMGEGVFQDCPNLTKALLSDAVKEIPNLAFSNDAELLEVTLGKKVTSISTDAFNKCSALKKMAFPTTLTSIGDRAFSGCTQLREVQLPEGLQSIGQEAFASVGFGGKTETQATEYGTLIIPSTVISIADRAFWQSPYLGEVIFKNGEIVELQLKESVFSRCTSLKEITFPDRLSVIPIDTCYACDSLEQIHFGKNISQISQNAFGKCISLKTVEIPGTVKVIGNEAFISCTALQEVCLNEGLQEMGDGVFASVPFGGKDEKQKLVYGKITIPSTVYKMGDGVFRGCTYLEEVIFANGSIELLEFKDRFEYSTAAVFNNCANLKRIYFPNRLKNISKEAITRCPNLETLYIPAGVETIDAEFLQNSSTDKLTIYGDPGTAAENFAKSHSIPFKDKKELDIYAKSISLNRRRISLSGQQAIGRMFVLQATVLPETALNKSVIYSSEDEQVATIDQEGKLTITGYGKTRIWVRCVEDDSIQTYCEVSVLKEWTDDEVNEVLKYISDNNERDLLTNVYENVGLIELNAPVGVIVTWRDPEAEVQTGEHCYTLCLQKDGYKAIEYTGFTIRGLTITGIQVETGFSVQTGKSHPISMTLLTEGAPVENLDYQLEWSSANDGNVSVNGTADSFNAVITGKKASKNTAVTVRLVLNRDGKAVSVEKKDLGKTWFTATTKVTVCDYPVVDDIRVTAKQGGEVIALEDLTKIYNASTDQTYELQAHAFADSEVVENAVMTWKSNNPKVATVKTDKAGNTILQVVGKGTALITISASKNGGYTDSFRVVVRDSKPRLVQKTVTVNGYLIDPSAEITILPSDGFDVDEESLSIVNAKDNSPSIFTIQRLEGDCYEIAVQKDTEPPKKGSYALKILAKTSAGEEESYALPVTVKVMEQKPKVTLWQKPINLYEKEGRGVVGIRTDAEIESITYTSASGIGTVRLVQDTQDDSSITLKAENAQADNFAKAANKGTLKVTFKGYRDSACYESKITLAVNKAPKLTASVEASTLYPGTAADTTRITVDNTSGNMGENLAVSAPDGYWFSKDFEFSKGMILQALRGAKSGKVVLTVTDDSWFNTVRPQVTCAIKIGKTPKLSFSSSTITLNTAYLVPDYDAAGVSACVKGFDHLEFTDELAQFTGKNAKAQDVLDSGSLLLYMENGEIKAGLTNADYFKKAGSYDYEVTAYTTEGKAVKGSFKVSVVLKAKAPAISFATKGEINLLERENTCVELTPKLKNYTGTIWYADLYGNNENKFEVSVEEGKLLVSAVSGAKISANTAYNLGIRVILDSGVELKTQVKITPRQKIAKLVTSAKTVTLYETAKGEAYGQNLKISAFNGAGDVIPIESIRLAETSDTFGYTTKGDGEGVLYVKDEASMIAGKTYTLKLEVLFNGRAANMKPTYVTVKVVYNK